MAAKVTPPRITRLGGYGSPLRGETEDFVGQLLVFGHVGPGQLELGSKTVPPGLDFTEVERVFPVLGTGGFGRTVDLLGLEDLAIDFDDEARRWNSF